MNEDNAAISMTAMQDVITQKLPSGPLYRYLKTRKHAERFVEGHIRISTLQSIRNAPGGHGDKDEGLHLYSVSKLELGDQSERARAIRSRVSVVIACDDMELENVSFVRSVPDAYVLCTTTDRSNGKFRSVFGHHVVCIQEPERFFALIEQALVRSGYLSSLQTVPPIRHVQRIEVGPVHYRGRSFLDDDHFIGDPGFASVMDYKWEKEIRFLARPFDHFGIEPVDLVVPEVAQHHICTLHSFVGRY